MNHCFCTATLRKPIVGFGFLAATACGRVDDGSATARRSFAADGGIQPAAFVDRFDLIDTLVLGSQDTTPVVRLSGVAWRQDGSILVADVSESNAKLYDADGRLIRILGRKGRGPGEFEQPRYPAIAESGQMAIGESNGFISFFDPEGNFLRRIFLTPGLGISSLSLRPGGGVVVTGWPAEKGVLAEYDSLGKELRRFLPRRTPPVSDNPDHPTWGAVTQYWHVMLGDTALVLSTLSDSVWLVDLVTNVVTDARVAVAGYVTPALPENPPSPRDKDWFKWVGAFHTSVGLTSASDGFLGFSLVKGVLHYGDPAIFVYRSPGGAWSAVNEPPPVLALRPGELLAIHRPNHDSAILARYRLRNP